MKTITLSILWRILCLLAGLIFCVTSLIGFVVLAPLAGLEWLFFYVYDRLPGLIIRLRWQARSWRGLLEIILIILTVYLLIILL